MTISPRDFQEVRTLGLVHGIQDFHMTVGRFGFAVLENISYLHIAEFHALNGISVAGFAVAQSGGGISAQNIVYTGFVINAGRWWKRCWTVWKSA